MSQTLEQKRAKYALDVVLEQKKKIDDTTEDKAKTKAKSDAEKFGGHIRKMPAMVLNNGLGQALAFLLADGKEPSKKLYDDIQEWLCGTDTEDRPRRIYTGSDELIKLLMNGDRDKYLQAQDETLSLLTWMTKFADAYLPKSGG